MLRATRFEELVVWQLSQDIKSRIFKVLKRPNVRTDYEYCRQTRKAVRSTPALIAEGFGRFRHKEFAHYLDMAVAELDETRNHLRDGAQCEYFSVEELRDLWRLCYRARAAAISLLDYLRSEEAKENEDKIRRRRAARKKRSNRRNDPPKENPS